MGISLSHARYEEIKRSIVDIFVKYDVSCVPVVHGKPGIDNHNNPSTVKRKLTRTEYQKYNKLFKGVKIDEGKYFS